MSWVSPVIAVAPFGAGNLMIFVGGALYFLDTYGPAAGASAFGANGLTRYAGGGACPLFVTQMYRALGIGWASSLFGSVSLFLVPLPFFFFKFGTRIRAKSRTAPK